MTSWQEAVLARWTDRGLVDLPGWRVRLGQRSCARREGRLVLRYSWHGYLALFGIFEAYEFVELLIHR